MARWPRDSGASVAARPAQGERERLSIAAQGSSQVQIFGRKDSRDTQKALRFFKERRVVVNFVDLAVKPLAPTELRRFTSRGARAVLDEDSRAFRDSGLAYLRVDDDDLFERLLRDQRLIRLPLIRQGNLVCVGLDEGGWKQLVASQ